MLEFCDLLILYEGDTIIVDEVIRHEHETKVVLKCFNARNYYYYVMRYVETELMPEEQHWRCQFDYKNKKLVLLLE